MRIDVLARFQHQRQLRIILLRHSLISQCRELIGEKYKQSHIGIVFVRWKPADFLPCFATRPWIASMTLKFAVHFTRSELAGVCRNTWPMRRYPIIS